MGFVFGGNPFASPTLLVPLVMFAWIPIIIYLFSRLPARRAVVVTYLVAWLFLPEAGLPIIGLPDFTKTIATAYGILIATVIFDVGRITTFRYSWIDIPMTIWCLCPFASSITNDLGPYDGASAVLAQTITWGLPYFLGRIYLNNLTALRELAVGIFIGGLVYIPLCLYEIRLSPQLHSIFYGGHARADFGQTMRLGGFRPTVFMEHGLAVGAFMMAATLSGIWLWQTGVIKQLWNIPMEWLVGALFITFILTRSTGAYGLLAIAIALLYVGKELRTAFPVFLLIAAIGTYLFINAETNTYFTDQLLEFLGQFLPEDRVGSITFRFNNEELLADRAREKLIFGWGGWGRALIRDANGNQLTIQDSLWIIAFGHYGTVGLVSFATSMLMPIFNLFWVRYPARLWTNRKVAPAAVIAIMALMYMIDCLVNALINPIYIIATGGIAGLVLRRESLKSRAQIRPKATVSRRFAIQPKF
ncbi:MAG: O-antigen ligase domain-containing protein [Oculatellaceae cyanobacterium Prado106]|jgi:hypothetical protein|nr:O-antigen ligase domain-containing protein [Oculatellaceae cyanobacterium Prado106]